MHSTVINKKGNPEALIRYKVNRGGQIWRRNGSIFIQKKDEREVLCCTPKCHPNQKWGGKKEIIPEEVARYNKNMSGINRCNKMVSYYSFPKNRKNFTKKVIFQWM